MKTAKGAGDTTPPKQTSEIGNPFLSRRTPTCEELYGQQQNGAGFVDASRQNPCPICGHFDWCGISADGARVICMRISDGALRETKNHGWLHRLSEGVGRSFVSTFQPDHASDVALASIEQRHVVYTALLESLTLSSKHADDLLKRGLHDTSIAYELYATVPDRDLAATLCVELGRRFDLTGVPGFYHDAEDAFEDYVKAEWRLNVGDWHTGIFIPSRDEQGRIQALRIRRDVSGKDGRYIWLSSKGKFDGVSSGAPMHWAAPHRLDRGEVIITEGELKAAVIAQMTDSAVLSLAGTSSFRQDLGEALRGLGVQWARLAFDADRHTNRRVAEDFDRLGRLLLSAGLAVTVLNWAVGDGKGLDDLLAQEVA